MVTEALRRKPLHSWGGDEWLSPQRHLQRAAGGEGGGRPRKQRPEGCQTKSPWLWDKLFLLSGSKTHSCPFEWRGFVGNHSRTYGWGGRTLGRPETKEIGPPRRTGLKAACFVQGSPSHAFWRSPCGVWPWQPDILTSSLPSSTSFGERGSIKINVTAQLFCIHSLPILEIHGALSSLFRALSTPNLYPALITCSIFFLNLMTPIITP